MRKQSVPLDPLSVLTRRELAAWLRKSERTIDRIKPPQILPGRYLLADVVEFLRAHRDGKAESFGNGFRNGAAA
jgi:hypothetical protein